MDKSWMQLPNRFSDEYRDGVRQFLDFAYANVEPGSKIRCPCLKCNNCYQQTGEVVKRHLLITGIVKSYNQWIHHGEPFESHSDDDYDDYESEPEVEDQEKQDQDQDQAEQDDTESGASVHPGMSDSAEVAIPPGLPSPQLAETDVAAPSGATPDPTTSSAGSCSTRQGREKTRGIALAKRQKKRERFAILIPHDRKRIRGCGAGPKPVSSSSQARLREVEEAREREVAEAKRKAEEARRKVSELREQMSELIRSQLSEMDDRIKSQLSEMEDRFKSQLNEMEARFSAQSQAIMDLVLQRSGPQFTSLRPSS